MTKDQIVAEAARRLGDSTAEFLAEVSAAFDFVLSDLSLHEAIGDLRKVSTADLIGLDQRDYSTRDLTGVASPDYPDRIISLRVWAWGLEGLINGPVSDVEYEAARAADGEDARGRPTIWRLWPNERQVQVHPPAGSDDAGATIECVYLGPPTTLSGSDAIEELRFEDLETIVFGLQARNAAFLDETVSDTSLAWQLYVAGRDKIWARRFNQGVRTIQPADPW